MAGKKSKEAPEPQAPELEAEPQTVVAASAATADATALTAEDLQREDLSELKTLEPEIAEALDTSTPSSPPSQSSQPETTDGLESLCREAKARLDDMSAGQDPNALRRNAEGTLLGMLVILAGDRGGEEIADAYRAAKHRVGF